MRAAGALALLCLASPASAQTVACAVTADSLAPGVARLASYAVGLVGGQVLEVVSRRPDGGDSRMALTPLRPGVSWRQVLWRFGSEQANAASTFNLVTVEPDAAVLIETWVTTSIRPAQPDYNWTRLRCGK